MKIKSSRPFQLLTIVFALSMLMAYVVYSQRERNRTVAPGSKSMALVNPKEPIVNRGTNQVQRATPVIVAPGSKAMAPLLDLRPPPAQQSAPILISRPAMVASGSKSGRVFDFQPTQQLQAANPQAGSSTNTSHR